MAETSSLSLAQLKRAVQIREEIDRLETELAGLLSGGAMSVRGPGRKRGRKPAEASSESAAPRATRKKTGKRTLSPEAREAIAAAQRRRWAKQKKAAKE